MTTARVIAVLPGLHLRAPGNHSHGHWSARAKAAKAERHAAYWALVAAAREAPPLPVVVTLTRVAPRPLDAHDNLPASFKHLVDGVADYLGVKDHAAGITWRYAQGRGAPRTYAVHIEVSHAAG